MSPKPMLLAVVLGACCAIQPANAADYEHMMAMSTMRIPDMMAGPVNTAALISPDGNRVLHIGTSNLCIIDAGTWDRLSCEEPSFKGELRGAEDMFWSPDGERMLMPNYTEAFMMFRDTDIKVFDPDTFAVTNLTDDHFEDGLMQRFSGTANFDVTPRWVDDDTIAFLRYVIPEEGMTARSGPVLMTVDVSGEESEQLFKPLAPDDVVIYTLAVSSDGQRFAYTIDERDGVKGAGLYLIDRADGVPQRLLTGAEMGPPPTGIAFSSDGRYLLLITPRNADLDARVVDLAGGTVIPVGEGKHVTGVAWSPTQAALAYIVDEGDGEDHQGGLYLSPGPGELGKMLVRGRFMPPVCCGRQVFSWANDNTILLGRIEDMNTTLEVKLGP